MKVSIIIPAHNATDTIQECLTRIFAAVAEREDCEIIVVDDGSDDDTAEIAAGFPVKLIRLECGEGRIRAREIGAEAASADRLLFVDTRVLIPPDTLRVLEGARIRAGRRANNTTGPRDKHGGEPGTGVDSQTSLRPVLPTRAGLLADHAER